MNARTYLADFHGYPLQIIDRDGQPWLTGEQIGAALGLKHPRRSINKIFNAHRDEFTPEMTCVTDMVTDQTRQFRIFSPRGAWMLGMWCQTERAKTFRKWVLDVLEGHQRQQIDLRALQQAALAAHPVWQKIARYKALGLNHREIAMLVGRADSTVRRHVRKMEQCGLIEPPKNLPKMQQLALNFAGGDA